MSIPERSNGTGKIYLGDKIICNSPCETYYCHYTLNNTLKESNGNFNDIVTTSASFQPVIQGSSKKCLYITSGNSYFQIPGINETLNEFTYLMRLNLSNPQIIMSVDTNDYRGDTGTQMSGNNKVAATYGGGFYYRRAAYNELDFPLNTWTLLSFRGRGSHWEGGINKNHNSSYVQGGRYDAQTYALLAKNIRFGRRSDNSSNSTQGYYSEIIIDNKYRSNDKIDAYYDLMKNQYGIS